MALLESDERRHPGQVSGLTGWVSVPPNGLRYGTVLGLCLVALSLPGCQSRTVIAAWSCPQTSEASPSGSAGAAGSSGTGGSGGTSEAFPLPWSTGFENGWCDFNDGRGSFVETGPQRKELVTEPVHSGSFAAALTVDTTNNATGQLRCIRRGSMPKEAYYGAWYNVPTLATNTGLWNLFHFQGDSTPEPRMWDISLVNNQSGDLRLNVLNWLHVTLPDQSKFPPIPIGSWFHIEMFWKRATDNTGEVIVYQDSVIILQLTNVKTDTSTSMVQWYVGNLADSLVPHEITVYIDDVSITATH